MSSNSAGVLPWLGVLGRDRWLCLLIRFMAILEGLSVAGCTATVGESIGLEAGRFQGRGRLTVCVYEGKTGSKEESERGK